MEELSHTDRIIAALRAEVEEANRPKRILMVEDEQLMIDLMRRWIAGFNAILDAETTFEGGLSRVASSDYDLILIDVRLASTKDGIDLFREIRTLLGDHPPVVFLTGHFDTALALRAEAIGFAPWIKKPEQINPKFIRSFLHCWRIHEK